MLKNIAGTPIVGSLGLNSVSVFNRNAVFGILLYGENTGKGIGARAITLLLKYAFQYIHLHKVSLWVRGDNLRAIACYKSCGFQECGRQREEVWIGDRYEDNVSMEILRSEWASISQK
ncbi:MAG: GNAT family protein [Candidatus Gracilibacteria bacterium]